MRIFIALVIFVTVITLSVLILFQPFWTILGVCFAVLGFSCWSIAGDITENGKSNNCHKDN